MTDQTGRGARILRAACKTTGIDLLIVPARTGPIEGMAWCDTNGQAFITITTDATGPNLARAIAHEMAHHLLGHTRTWTSLPTWHNEYTAELKALEWLAEIYGRGAILDRLTLDAKDHVRSYVQPFIDDGIDHHGEIHAGDWCGAEIPDALRDLNRQRMAKPRPSTGVRGA